MKHTTRSFGATQFLALFKTYLRYRPFISPHSIAAVCQLHLHLGTSEQIAEMARTNRIDLAIARGSRNLFDHYVLLLCYRWHRRIIVEATHPLAKIEKPSLAQLAAFPRVTVALDITRRRYEA